MSEREKLIETMARAICVESGAGPNFWPHYVNPAEAALTAIEAAGMRLVPAEPGSLPELPADDRDFTPDLARKIIRIYQSMLAAQEDSTSE